MADNKFNTEEMLARCVPLSRLQSVLSDKWKILILWYVTFYKVQRFGELMRRLDGITQSTLTKQLREPEQDGFLHREDSLTPFPVKFLFFRLLPAQLYQTAIDRKFKNNLVP
ncbi:MAG: helix-turn-helix domain-containing protein [Lachnospiraceae bacterium]|nr:helix-turn-helix domain-containing protein [Lachnospiraceae bacterium]